MLHDFPRHTRFLSAIPVPRCRGLRRGMLAVVLCVLPGAPAVAHDSPGDVVHALTHRMESQGPTARLLAARAFEYQYLGAWDAAIADFEAAIERQPRYSAAIEGLAQVLLRQNHLDRAMAVAQSGLKVAGTADRAAPYHAIIARAHARAKRWEPALGAWYEALQSGRPQVDWFLEHARCLARLDRYEERAQALDEARQRNPSVVLERAWIHALVDAGRGEIALPEIGRQLERARWKSVWLLLRARLHAHDGRSELQRADAEAALQEINQRWSGDISGRDPMLLTQAALAFALLGQDDKAQAHLDAAQRHGVSEERLFDFQRALARLTLLYRGG